MKTISAQQMKQIDQRAINEFGIPSVILMENAGKSAAEVAIDILGDTNKQVICVCGKGNNGGDGFVCARHLINKGVQVAIFLIGDAAKLQGEAKVNFLILQKMQAEIYYLQAADTSILEEKVKEADLVIDAIFGIGIKGSVREPYGKIINMINAAAKKVLAVDIPSGLDADNGKPLGTCIKADTTVTFAAAKSGCCQNQGRQICGRLIVVDISIPAALL